MTAMELLNKYNRSPRCKIIQGTYDFLGKWHDFLVYTCYGPNDKNIPFNKFERAEVYRFEFREDWLYVYVKDPETIK